MKRIDTAPLHAMFGGGRRFPVVRQHDRMDCGPACLLRVLRHHGGNAALVTVREAAQTDVHGTSLFLMQRAAEILGFEATAPRAISTTCEL